MIQINNINQFQKNLLDKMWSIDSAEDFENWYQSQNSTTRNTIDVLMEMLQLAILEEKTQEEHDLGLGRNMLKSIGVKL